MAFMKNAWAMLKSWAEHNVIHIAGAGAPVNGTSGTGVGVSGPGSTYTDITNKLIYVNTNTAASPTWTRQSVTAVMSGDATEDSAGVVSLDQRLIDYAEVTVSSAELLALRATPKTLVAAPGAGKVLQFLSAILIADNGTAYVVGTNDIAIRYKDGTGDIISNTVDTAGLLDQTVDIMTQVLPLITDSKTPKADCENMPLVLHNTGAGELTTGTGVVRVKINYNVWTTGW